MTCGAIFIGSADKHKAETGHHIFFQFKGFVCKKCFNDFNTDNFDDDLKRMSDRLKSSYGKKIATEAMKKGVKLLIN